MPETSMKPYFYLACIMGCTLLYVLFQGGKVAVMLLIMCFILFLYLLLGRWSGIARVQGERQLLSLEEWPELEAGSSVQIRLDLWIPGFWPLPYVLVTDTIQREGEGSWPVELSFVPDWKRRGQITYQTAPLRRGVYNFARTECSTEDVFGFFRHHGSMELNRSFRVVPKTVAIPNWILFNQLAKGLLYHSASIKSRRETTQINGVREYVYGDRISRIHWNASARTGTWKSKEFERESLPRLLVIVDAENKNYANSEDFELAVSIAASILKFGQKHGLAAGLSINADAPVWLEPKQGDMHYREMADELVRAEASGEHAISEHLFTFDPSAVSQTFAVLVSPGGDSLRTKFQYWLESLQLPGCYLHVAHSEQALDMELNAQPMSDSAIVRSYSVRKLEDLPHLLGGGNT